MLSNKNIHKTLEQMGIKSIEELDKSGLKNIIRQAISDVLANNLYIVAKYQNYNADALVDILEDEEPSLVEKIINELESRGVDVYAFGELSIELSEVFDEKNTERDKIIKRIEKAGTIEKDKRDKFLFEYLSLCAMVSEGKLDADTDSEIWVKIVNSINAISDKGLMKKENIKKFIEELENCYRGNDIDKFEKVSMEFFSYCVELGVSYDDFGKEDEEQER